MAGRRYASFREFYPFYLTEHSRSGTRRLHFAGTLLVLLTLAYALATQRWAALVSAAGLWLRVRVGGGTSSWSGTDRPPSPTRSTVWPATSGCSRT